MFEASPMWAAMPSEPAHCRNAKTWKGASTIGGQAGRAVEGKRQACQCVCGARYSVSAIVAEEARRENCQLNPRVPEGATLSGDGEMVSAPS